MENNKQEEYNPAEDPAFFDQAVEACMDLGLSEEEAEQMVEDYYNLY